ncbi:MAG: DUF1176 domain-containing protein [Leptolyngbyaceae cyanobacterium]
MNLHRPYYSMGWIVLLFMAGHSLGVFSGATAAEAAIEQPAIAEDTPATSELPPEDVIVRSVLEEVQRTDQCNGFYDPNIALTQSQVLWIGNSVLVEVVCTLTAYQLIYTYSAYASDGSILPLPLDTFYRDEAGGFERSNTLTLAGLADFDHNRNELAVFSKARGLGDCGSWAAYQWTGMEFVLTTFRYQVCGDSAGEYVAPTDYPQVFPFD